MYEAFYHLSTNPFRLTPDPEFCFSHSGYQSAREYLDYALRLGEGFIMVTGRPGMGKTTLAEAFLKDLDLAEVEARRIAASSLEADDLLRAVAYAYGIEAENLDRATLRRRIQQYFARQGQSGRRSLLIIDEAQGVPHSALEELRLLADMQAGNRPLLQLFLVGQEKLRDLMTTPEMDQFQQRIIATCHLTPLDLAETRSYIRHRLRQAGWEGDPELTGAAVLAIHQCSNGVPRHINKLCNRLLLLGFGKGKHLLDKGEVQAVSGELRLEQLTPLGSRQEMATPIDSPRPLAVPEAASPPLSELALRMDRGEAKEPVMPVVQVPVSRSGPPAATRQTRQAAAWRMDAAARSRREKQRGKPSVHRSRRAGVADPVRARQRHKGSLVRLLTQWTRWKEELALGVAALVVATLSVAGLTRFSGEERIDPALLSAEQILQNKPSMPAHDRRPADTAILSSRAGSHRPVSQPPTAIQPATAETTPIAGTTRIDGQVSAPVDEVAAIQPGTPEKVTIIASPGRSPAIPPAATSGPPRPALATETPDRLAGRGPPSQTKLSTRKGTESITVPGSGEDVRITGVTEALPDFERLDPPAAGGQAGQAGLTSDPAGPRAVSQKVKIAGLLAMGQQSLVKYRLLTPERDNAYRYYQQVLALDPGNTAALEGLERIAARYVTLVRRANQRQETALARIYLARGLSVQPDDRELLALRDRMVEPQPAAQQVAVMQSTPDVDLRSREDDFFSLLRTLFSSGQQGQAEVLDRSIPSQTP